MPWWQFDDAPSFDEAQLIALEDVVAGLARQRTLYAPRAQAVVGVWAFAEARMVRQASFAYRGRLCEPVTFERPRMRAAVEALHHSLAHRPAAQMLGLRVGLEADTNRVTLAQARTPAETGADEVTPSTWRNVAARHDPRGRFRAQEPRWPWQRASLEVFRPTAERYLEAWQARRVVLGAASQETIGLTRLDAGLRSTIMMTFDRGERRDHPAVSGDPTTLHAGNLLDETAPELPAALLTYAAPGGEARVVAVHADAARPWADMTRHDLLAPRIRALFTDSRGLGHSAR